MSHFDDKDEIVKSINKKIRLSTSEKNAIFSQINEKINHKRTKNSSMRFKYYFALASTCAIFLILLFPTFSSFLQGSSNQQQGAKVPNEVVEVVNKYFEALATGDVDVAVQYSHDTRHRNKEAQREQYETINPPTTETEVLDIRRITADEYEVTVQIFEDDSVLELSFPVKKMDVGWQVVVGMDIKRE